MVEIKRLLINKFEELFGKSSQLKLFFAPGRVNLIGEHTDYNGGNVFPCALNIGTYALVSPRQDSECRLFSLNFEQRGIINFSLDDLKFDPNHDWANYPKGVIVEFINASKKLNHGFDIIFFGNIPNGAGLSSSASIEVLTGTILNTYLKNTSEQVSKIDIALIGQAAENKYIGVGCGIMDQFASAMGKANHAILLDCNTLEYQYAPLDLGSAKIVIINTNKRRGLADSKYNERLAECRKALTIVQEYITVKSLGEVTEEQIDQLEPNFGDKTIYRRARHAVYENQRTLKAVTALKQNNLALFGKLMAQSHNSLKEDYEVTGLELDALVNAASIQEGCIGARMTGAGFGGCTVNIVEEKHINNFINNVKSAYKHATGLEADFYIVEPSDGARELGL